MRFTGDKLFKILQIVSNRQGYGEKPLKRFRNRLKAHGDFSRRDAYAGGQVANPALGTRGRGLHQQARPPFPGLPQFSDRASHPQAAPALIVSGLASGQVFQMRNQRITVGHRTGT